MKHQRPVLVTLAGLVSALAVLLGTALPTAHADESRPPGAAWVRAGHLVPGVGTTRIDLVPRSGPATSIVMSPAASYGDVTKYQKVDPGDYTVAVRPQGASLASSPMLQRAFTVVAGKATTLAVLGTSNDPRLVVLDDDLTPPTADTARVRVLPAASHAQTVSVMAVSGPTLTSGAVLGQATAYASVPAGSWTLNLTGTNGPSAQQTVTLASGSVYTAVVLDSSTGVVLQVITDAAGATTTPVGAAQTGGGGMAGDVSGEAPGGARQLLLFAFLAVTILSFGVVRVTRGEPRAARPAR